MTLRLTADELDYWVEAPVRGSAGRWIAVTILGDAQLGTMR
jgi:hypothetical protein